MFVDADRVAALDIDPLPPGRVHSALAARRVTLRGDAAPPPRPELSEDVVLVFSATGVRIERVAVTVRDIGPADFTPLLSAHPER
jgi:hypothetical protein